MMRIAAEIPPNTDLSPSIDIRGGRFPADSIANWEVKLGTEGKDALVGSQTTNRSTGNGHLRRIACLVEAAAPENEPWRRRVVTSDNTLGLPTARRRWEAAVSEITAHRKRRQSEELF